MKITLEINHQITAADIEPGETLLKFLRKELSGFKKYTAETDY